MSRYKTAEYMALTDPYWRGYIDGLADKHNVRDTSNTPDATRSGT